MSLEAGTGGVPPIRLLSLKADVIGIPEDNGSQLYGIVKRIPL